MNLDTVSREFIFFFNDPAPTEISPLPLHDALPISASPPRSSPQPASPCRWTAAYYSRHARWPLRSEEHTSELQSQSNLVCRLLLEKKNSSFDRLPASASSRAARSSACRGLRCFISV